MTHIPEVSVHDVKQHIDLGSAILLLDVRQPDEHRVAKIRGAELIPLPELEKRIDDVRALANGRPIITHCHHGARSLRAAEILRKAGFEDVKSMAGGIDLWSQYIDPAIPRY